MSWRIDETYVRVRGQWAYLYRALDKLGNTIDFYLSSTRNTRRHSMRRPRSDSSARLWALLQTR